MTLTRAGGFAALVAAGTYLVGFALLLGVLEPAGFRTSGADAAADIAFLAGNQALMVLWNLVIYVLNAVTLVVLAIALHALLREGAPALAAVATAFGLIWAGLVLASGMVANVGTEAVLALNATDPAAAATLWQAVGTVENGLGGGNEITGGLWVLLLSLAALRVGVLHKPLNWLGIAIGAAGLITVVPGMSDIGGPIFGLGFIVWFVWAGVALLRA